MNTARWVLCCLLAAMLCACASPRRCRVRCRPAPSKWSPDRVLPAIEPATVPADAKQALFDGDLGIVLDADGALARLAGADVVLFGELHGDLVGAALQMRVLRSMHAAGRPVALAMEFLERDVQPALDRYLRGEIDEATFRKQARQDKNKAYAQTHGPLVNYCKANGIPVIAANAPRPLVKAYRKTDADYGVFLASLTEAERGTLPRATSTPDDPYKERFMDFMGPKRGPSFFRAQALWDDAMAEAVADWRNAHPDTRVLLVVGAFHVNHGGGTLTKIRARRPTDEVATLVMDMVEPPLSFVEGDRGAGDVLLKVPLPPKKPEAGSPES